MKKEPKMFLFVVAILLCVNVSFATRTIGDWAPIYQGVWVATGSDTSPRLMRAYAIRVDTAHPAVSAFATPHSGSLETTVQTTPAFMSYYACEAAINTNYIVLGSQIGSYADPHGLVISNGSVVSNYDAYPYNSQLRFTSDMVATLVEATSNPSGIYTAVGGAEFVLRDGAILDWTTDLDPRTGMGLSEGNRFLIMVVIDGRQPGYSDGCTYRELAQWLIDFGAYDGVNFDGGGSSCICTASGGVLNSPCEGTPRAVCANLGVNSSTYNPRMDVWVLGNSDGAVKKKTWTQSGGWDGSWGDYGAPACGINPVNGITAVSRGPHLLDLFVIGNDNKIYRKAYNGSSWGSWDFVSNLPSGVSCSSGLDACSWDINRIDLVYVGNNGHLYRKTAIIGSGWESVVDEGGTLDPNKKPTIVAWGPNRLDIFAADADGTGIMHRRYNGTSWLAWVERAGSTLYGLDAVSSSYGTVHVFYTTNTGAVYRNTYNSEGTWSGATNLGGNFNSAPSATSYEQGQLMVFARNASDGKCYRRNYVNLSWDAWSGALNAMGMLSAPGSCSWSNDAGTHLP